MGNVESYLCMGTTLLFVELVPSENELRLLPFSAVSGSSTPHCALPNCLLLNPTLGSF